MGQGPKIQDWTGLNSDMGSLGLFRRRDAPFFVNGGKMKNVEAGMCSILVSKMHLTFYQERMVVLKFQCFKVHDINTNHYHSDIMCAVGSIPSALTVLRPSHTQLLNF